MAKRGFLRLVMAVAALLAMAQLAVGVALLVAEGGAIGPAVQLLVNATVCVVSAWGCSAVLTDDREARAFAEVLSRPDTPDHTYLAGGR